MNPIDFFPESELMIHKDGSIFHLCMKPEQLADKIILVGDPGRVEAVSAFFETVESRTKNREFHSATGRYAGKRISVISTGIGTDNIDIVLNEIDALANIDLTTRRLKKTHRQLDIVRIGTCGSLQPDIPVGSFLISEKSVGLDGMLNFYAGKDLICDIAFEKAFCEQTGYPATLATPYVVPANSELMNRIDQGDMLRGITVTANGFYGPQGRKLRLMPADPAFNTKLEHFRYGKYRITNYEMESAGIAGLAGLMGHHAMTVCLVIVNRFVKNAKPDYPALMTNLIRKILERL